MIGWDFLVFWRVGEAVLHGLNPYVEAFSLYPPATTLLFALFALIPYWLAFGLWSGLNLVLYRDVLKRFKLSRWAMGGWLLYAPALFVFLTGQIDIIFLWLAVWLPGGGWKAAAAGAALTLKPQLAVVVLPWFLVRWLIKDRRLLVKWLGVSLGLHLLPLLVDGAFYAKWFDVLSRIYESRMSISAGIFSLSEYDVPLGVLVVGAVVVAVWGLFQDELGSRAAQLVAFPVTIWYDAVLLVNAAPLRLIVPYSWVMFLLAVWLQSNIPLATIPLVVLVWRLSQSKGLSQKSHHKATQTTDKEERTEPPGESG